MTRGIGRLRPRGDMGASLVFVLVAVTVLALLLGSFSRALWGGFLAQRLYAEDTGQPSRSEIENALLVGVGAIQNPGTLKGKGKSAACYAAGADGSTGTNYINYPPGAPDPVARVFCTIYTAKASAADLSQPNTQPDLKNGLSVAEKLWVCGNGNYIVQGPVAAKQGINFYGTKADGKCDTGIPRASDCEAASEGTIYSGTTSPSGGYCPGFYVEDADAGDGTINASACVPATGVWAETSTNCANPSVDVSPDQRVPAAMPGTTLPAGLKVADLASSGDPAGAAITCDPSTNTVTLSPGVYDDALALGGKTDEFKKFFNALGARTATCTQQGSALNAASTSLTSSLSVAERAGFLPGDTLTVSDTVTDADYMFTVSSAYTPTTGAGAIPVTPATKGTAYPVAPVVVGRPLAALSVAATTQLAVTATTSNNNSGVDLTLGTRTATKKGFVSGSATAYLASSLTFAPQVGQYLVGAPVNSGTTVSSVTDVAAVSATFSFAKDATVLTWPGTIDPSIYVGQTVTGTGLGANTTVSAISGNNVTLSPRTSSTQTGVTLTFAPHTKITMSQNAKANSDNAVMSFYTAFAANQAPAVNQYVTTPGISGGLPVTAGTLVKTVTTSGPVITDLTLSKNTPNSGAGTGFLTLTGTFVTGSATNGSAAAPVGAAPKVADIIDFASVGGTASPSVNASTCVITALTSSNSEFTCTLLSTDLLSAETLVTTEAVALDLTSPVVTATTAAPGLTTVAGTVVLMEDTGISALTGNLCTVTTGSAGGSPFTCTLATAPTEPARAASGTLYEAVPIASTSPVQAARTCVNAAASWCRGTARPALTLAAISSNASKTFSITTKTPHGLVTGDWVKLEGLGKTLDGFAKGTWQITGVSSAATFTVEVATAPLTAVSGTSGKATPQARIITKVILSPGTFYLDLQDDWIINNSGISITGGQMPTGVAMPDGEVSTCIPSYSASEDGLSADDLAQVQAQGVTLVMGGDKGIEWSTGAVDLCPKAVNVDATPTDRPVTIYGPGAALTTSGSDPASIPAYYGQGANVSVTIAARSTCAAASNFDTCEVVYVPPARRSLGTDGTALTLRGAIFAPTSRVTLTLNYTNDDSFEMYGMVVNSLVVGVTAVPTGGVCTPGGGIRCSNGGKISSMTPFFRITAYPCTEVYNGTSICTQTTQPEATWIPPGQTFKFFTPGARNTSVPKTGVTSASVSGSTVTVTTATPHLLTQGNWVTLTGLTPGGYGGTVRVASVPSPTTFRYELASAPSGGPTVAAAAGLAWLPTSCPPRDTYPWAGCMTVKIDPTTVDTGTQFIITGPSRGALDCPDATEPTCWAIFG